jgi:hypothetical protein
MSEHGGLAVYVTSHGFGHLTRTAAVINRLPSQIPVTVRCHANLFDHWRERLRRPVVLEEQVSDAGAVSPPGDSNAIDGSATLALAAHVHAEAMARVDAEAQKLRDERTRAVLCDAPPMPLVAARRAGIAGFLLANFTWADIYAPHARRVGGEALRLVADLRRAYRQATTLFRTEPALRMAKVAPISDVGMIVAHGRDRGSELRRQLGLDTTDRLVYFYVGRYGQHGLSWRRLEELQASRIHFVGFHPADGYTPANLHVVSPLKWTGADLSASTDAVVAKAGYGTVCEAMVAGTPILYPPRTGFAEYRVLDRALRTWGGGIPLSSHGFAEMRFREPLERAFALDPGPAPFAADGAAVVAARLAETCLGSSAGRCALTPPSPARKK